MDIPIDFKARREAVFAQLPENSLAIFASAPAQYRNSHTEHLYRQESYFYYLTGFNESFAIAVMIKNHKGNQYILFCQDRDKAQEQWTGKRAGVEGAKTEWGADAAYPISEASIRFPAFFDHIETVFYLVGIHPSFERKLFSWINALRTQQRRGIKVPHHFVDLRILLDKMRLIKTKEEIACIKKACDISVKGHRRAMQKAAPGLYEYSLEAELLHVFYQEGSRHVAYNSIVACGANACTLHYDENNAPLKDKQLVLIDAGCEYQNYAADITRTFPVNGQFTKEQQALYECVLNAQTAAIQAVKPGALWGDMQQSIIAVLVQGLVDLKILHGDIETLIKEEAYKPFYMHSSGHWLGLDVHDVGDYKINDAWCALQPNMVFTIEPGLYISEDELSVDEKFRGIGIRIEDDILVTETGCDVLTQALPKSVNEIERLMKAR